MKKISLLMLIMAGTMIVFTSCKNEKEEANASETTEQEMQVDESLETATLDSNMPGDTYEIESGTSKLHWFATKVGGKHNGTVDLKDGFLKIEDDQITGGIFSFDMSSITVLDLDGEWKMKLENHLKGVDEDKQDHFFNVQKFPTATFKITKVTNLEGSDKGKIMVYGDLTIKGKTNPVGTIAAYRKDGDAIKIEVPELIIDRTKWGVNYNSKKIFSDIQDNIIHDDIRLSFGIEAGKA